MPDLSRRELIPELMDDPAVDAHALFAGLRFLDLANSALGGSRLLVEPLESALKDGHLLTIVDIGTGGAEIPRILVSRAGCRVQAIGLDLHERTLEFARRMSPSGTGVELVRGNALALPLATGSCDFAISSTFIHHLTDEEIVSCLAEMRRVARRGVIVTDLERSAAAYWMIRLFTLLFGNRITRHDGPVSVQRALSAGELTALARKAGLPEPVVERRVPFRLVLSATW